jgi:sortase A
MSVGRRAFVGGAAVLGLAGAVGGRALFASGSAPSRPPASARTVPEPTSTTARPQSQISPAAPIEAIVPEVDDPSFDLPDPTRPPSDPYEDVAVRRLGTIAIPSIGLEHDVFEGVWLTVIDRGPGHWPGSALPGQTGNSVFPGHRVTHSHPFLDLDRLGAGDEIRFSMGNGEFVYRVRETLIVSPKDMWVVDQTTTPEVTLIACHPKHSARQRIVVKGDFVTATPSAAARAAANTIATAAGDLAL